MKYFLIPITFLLLFTACSYQNAFTKFEMSTEEELIAANSQSSKIKSESSVIGIFNAVYINNTDTKYFDDKEHFLVSIYLKDTTAKQTYKLNNQAPLEIRELTNVEEYSTYIKFPKQWERHYLVTFKKSSKKMKLILESKGYDSQVLHFQKY